VKAQELRAIVSIEAPQLKGQALFEIFELCQHVGGPLIPEGAVIGPHRNLILEHLGDAGRADPGAVFCEPAPASRIMSQRSLPLAPLFFALVTLKLSQFGGHAFFRNDQPSLANFRHCSRKL
jgi:hypothetical protein